MKLLHSHTHKKSSVKWTRRYGFDVFFQAEPKFQNSRPSICVNFCYVHDVFPIQYYSFFPHKKKCCGQPWSFLSAQNIDDFLASLLGFPSFLPLMTKKKNKNASFQDKARERLCVSVFFRISIMLKFQITFF